MDNNLTPIETFEKNPKNKLKRAFGRAIEAVKVNATRAIAWAEKNPSIAIPLALSVAKGIFDAAKDHRRNSRYKRELDDRMRTVYDPSSGIHYRLKHAPTSRQQRLIKRRLDAGENKIDILEDIGLL